MMAVLGILGILLVILAYLTVGAVVGLLAHRLTFEDAPRDPLDWAGIGMLALAWPILVLLAVPAFIAHRILKRLERDRERVKP